LRRANAGDDVLALRVDQELAIIGVLAGRRIARERHAGRRGIAHIAEHHRLDVDRGAPVAGDIVEAAIDLGALGLPRAEHRADRAPELVVHVLREGLAPQLLHDRLVLGDQRLPVLGRELGVEMEAAILLGDLQRFLEAAMIELEHHIRVHLDEAAIAVPGEALVAADRGEADNGRVVEAEVEHRVHHARHRRARAGTDRDEQRIGGVAECLAGDPLDMGDAVGDFGLHAIGEDAALIIIDRAHRGADRETGRHRQADPAMPSRLAPLPPSRFLSPLPPSDTPPPKR
jgi:hypothetical protein